MECNGKTRKRQLEAKFTYLALKCSGSDALKHAREAHLRGTRMDAYKVRRKKSFRKSSRPWRMASQGYVSLSDFRTMEVQATCEKDLRQH